MKWNAFSKMMDTYELHPYILQFNIKIVLKLDQRQECRSNLHAA
jgi:hypothetical protein